MDSISEIDISYIYANILVKGKHRDESFVYLFGPGIVTHKEATETINAALNSNPTITPIYGEDAIEFYKQQAPKPIARYLV